LIGWFTWLGFNFQGLPSCIRSCRSLSPPNPTQPNPTQRKREGKKKKSQLPTVERGAVWFSLISSNPFGPNIVSEIADPMAAVAVASYRDRTAEFRSLTETLKKVGGISSADSAGNDPSTASQPPSSSARSEFNKKASRIGLGIHEANRKIARLAQCNSLQNPNFLDDFPI